MIRTAAPRLVAALVVLTFLQGLIPAGVAMALRGLINAAAGAGAAVDASSSLLGWVALAFVLTAAGALAGLAVDYVGRRLADELNLHLTGEILAHAWSLDLRFFEDPARQDLLTRTQANVGVQLQGLVLEALNVPRQLLTAIALLAVLAAIEPLVLLVVPPFRFRFSTSSGGWRNSVTWSSSGGPPSCGGLRISSPSSPRPSRWPRSSFSTLARS